MESIASTTNRTEHAQVTPSSNASGATPAVLADRPPRRLTAVMPEALRAIDWNGHVPTAPHGPVTMTRAQVSDELAATAGDDDWQRGPVVPKLPAKRRPADKPLIPRQPSTYDEHVLGFGAIHAHSAFAA